MWRATRLWALVHTVRPVSSVKSSSSSSSSSTEHVSSLLKSNKLNIAKKVVSGQPLLSLHPPTKTIILDGLESSIVQSKCDTNNVTEEETNENSKDDNTYNKEGMHTSAKVVDSANACNSVQSNVIITARQLWQRSQLIRANKHVRRTNEACVVGGSSAIHRIWRLYGIRPNVVYIPDTSCNNNNTGALEKQQSKPKSQQTILLSPPLEEQSNIPNWMLEDLLPTIIVKASIIEIKRELLSAEYSDGYAAEFPCDAQRILPITNLLINASDKDEEHHDVDEDYDNAKENKEEREVRSDETSNNNSSINRTNTVKAMLVLVGLRIPSNVGTLLRAAVDMQFDSVVLINTVDALHEKVLRACDGALFHPNLHIYEAFSHKSLVELLSRVALQHHLMPLLAVPSQEVPSAVSVAKVVHSHRMRPMLILGAESEGLQALDGQWSVPHQFVNLPLPNPHIDSYNVAAAGSILMHYFRPAAQVHFAKMRKLTGEDVDGIAKPCLPEGIDNTASIDK